MPKKRKQGACLHCCKKQNRPGREIVRLSKNGIVHNIKNHFTSTEPNSNRDDGFFDVIDFEMKHKELDKRK